MSEPSRPDFPVQVSSTDELVERLRRATLGEYEIQGDLGAGGMAAVFMAHDIALDRKVAIKVMHPAMVFGDGMVERFKREARTAASLSHPNIIPVYAVREAEGLLFFVMKLIQGTPLESVMHELGQLPLPMIEAILGQVGSALAYAHRKGVVHRDVKPANILIDEDGWAVVTDFGIAKVAESEGLTVTGMAVGTPTYMSPEQALGGEISGATDQYALGVVAYEMLGGKPPFAGGNPMSLMYAHCHEPPPSLGEVRPDCPDQLREVVERMLEKQAADRWPTMDDMLSAMGLKVLAPDDPNRSQLIEIARTGARMRLSTKVQTPRSPIPLGRTSKASPVPGSPAPPAPRPWAWAGAAAVLAIAAVLWIVRPASAPNPQPDAPADATVPPIAVPEAAAADSSTAGPRVSQAPAPAPPSAGSGTAAVGERPRTQPPAGGVTPPRQELPRVPSPATESAAAASPRPADSNPVEPPRSAAVPPVVRPEVTAPVPSPPVLPTDDRVDVEALIQRYARALQSGDLAQALRLFPAMPADLRQGLQSFYGSGGAMEPRWAVSDVTLAGNTATARISGSNLVRTTRGGRSEERVNLRARLERTAAGWKLTALVN
jgi:serine/threonine-protein kinase